MIPNRKLSKAERIVLGVPAGKKRIAEVRPTAAPSAPVTKKSSNLGGFRPGAGAPPRDPDAGPRVMVSMRLHPDTIRRLKMLAAEIDGSQAVAVDEAVERRFKAVGLRLEK